MRVFETGATRDNDETKLDYEGFLSPLVLERFAQYMHAHRKQADGKLRASDDWQKGVPKEAYMKSMFRHFIEVWKAHRTTQDHPDIEDSLCGVMFNAMGYMYEIVKARQSELPLVNETASVPSSDGKLGEIRADTVLVPHITKFHRHRSPGGKMGNIHTDTVWVSQKRSKHAP